MSRWRWGTLILFSLAVVLIAGNWIRVPGYMDAEYYFATAQQLVRGVGFTEPFIWNYLDDPIGLPHPSHLYWMPLTSIVATGSMTLLGSSYRAGQLPFLVLTAFLPVMTVFIALRLHGDERNAWRAGFFSIFSGFYLPYFLSTDSFILYAWIGGLALWAMAETCKRPSALRWLGVGLLVGLGHMSRADGLLLFVPAFVALGWSKRHKRISLVTLFLGYLVVVAPWFIRNINAVGHPFPPGNERTLWLLSYDELFSYPAQLLTPERWLESGFFAIATARLQSLWTNVQRVIGENGMIFLGPFMVIGARQYWGRSLIRLTAIYFFVLLFVMSFIFPFAGAYGGFFHSGTAFMPVLWVLAPIGLENAIAWGAKIRGWKRGESITVLITSALVMSGLLTIGLMWSKAVGPSISTPRWGASYRTYMEIGDQIRKMDSSPGIVAVNNPPGFYLASGLEAIVVPNGTRETLRQVVERYGASWVVLDVNRPVELAELYEAPESGPWLDFERSLNDEDGHLIHLFRASVEMIQP